MKNELIINGKDAFTTWGVRMGDNFLGSLLQPPPLKDLIENKSRQNNGKDVNFNNIRIDERDVTLVFTIQGNSQEDYISKHKAFLEEITKGLITVNVPALGNEVYHIYYLRSTSFALNISRTFSKLSVKFNEPNPANR